MFRSGFTVTLHDVLDNKFSITNEGKVNGIKLSNMHSCFLSASRDIINTNRVEQGSMSLLLDETNFVTFIKWSEMILYKLRIIEWSAIQLAYGQSYYSEVDQWRTFNQIEIEIRDCRCGPLEYEHYIDSWHQCNFKLTKAFQLHFELSRLVEVVRNEMAHAEARLLDGIKGLRSLILDLDQEHRFNGKIREYVSYSIKTDNVGWCIVDVVKALSTALDGLSKYVFLLSKVDKDVFPKTPSVLAIDLHKYQPQGTFVASESCLQMLDLFNNVRPLINLRHELTHNQSLYPIRQPAFVGYGTPCVNNVGIAYAEILWWDRNGDTYARSCGRTGFLKQKRNAIIEAHESFKGTYKLVNAVIDIVMREVLSRLEYHGITEITYMKMSALGDEDYVACSLRSLLQ